MSFTLMYHVINHNIYTGWVHVVVFVHFAHPENNMAFLFFGKKSSSFPLYNVTIEQFV